MSKNAKSNSNPYAIRWRPDFRYRTDKLIEIGLENFKSHEPSVTDKEAYRLTLASLRGEIAQGSGKIDVGSYSLKPGQSYDPNLDFSFLNRKDLTIVELDDHIKILRRQLEESDSDLVETIKGELAKAELKHQELSKDTSNKNDEVSK